MFKIFTKINTNQLVSIVFLFFFNVSSEQYLLKPQTPFFFIKTRGLNYNKCKTIQLQLENYLFLTTVLTIVLTAYRDKYILNFGKTRNLNYFTLYKT